MSFPPASATLLVATPGDLPSNHGRISPISLRDSSDGHQPLSAPPPPSAPTMNQPLPTSLPPPPPSLPKPVFADSSSNAAPEPSKAPSPPPPPPEKVDSQNATAVKSENTVESRQDMADVSETSNHDRNSAPMQTSHLTTNLLSIFHLDPLAASVARFDPLTGEKINKMRKSYEGQLKTLGLAGKNKSVKHEDALASTPKMMGLAEMAAWPDEEWQNQMVLGKSVHKGWPDGTKTKLAKALQLQPGNVPDSAKWEDILGFDRPAKPGTPNEPDTHINGNANVPKAAGSEHIRARRATKKRRYDDRSFEGYGEGYADDVDFDGYESGETYTSRGSRGDKKRLKREGGAGSRNPSVSTGYPR